LVRSFAPLLVGGDADPPDAGYCVSSRSACSAGHSRGRYNQPMLADQLSDVLIEKMTAAEWNAVREIYLEGIATGNATFEMEAPDWRKWDAGHLQSCRFVARLQGQATPLRGEIVGWAALSPVSARKVYSGVTEVSVYVAERVRGKKVGSRLLAELITVSEREGIWTLNAGIFPENTASIELHQRHGFRVVGTRERVGCMNGRWRDVTLLERRSQVVGT